MSGLWGRESEKKTGGVDGNRANLKIAAAYPKRPGTAAKKAAANKTKKI